MRTTYNGLSHDELQELFSNFLISSWSYSKVTTFARHEKAFEMQYIYGLYSRKSATTTAGNAYHKALEYYFSQKKLGKEIDLVELEASAFQYLDEVPANAWKLQKTTPSVESCQQQATKIVSALCRNFYKEKVLYEEDIDEILDIEVKGEEFIAVNGVDIPLPFRFQIDLVIKTKEGRVVIVDHKSKKTFTDDEEAAYVIGIQAIGYVIGYEAMTGITPDEVWFVENKYSQNKDGSSQLVKIPVEINSNTRKLYEALLYEPLKRMIEAVSNPDYVYMINDADNYVDKAEIYDFWVRTMICEVEDFNVDAAKKDLVAKRLKKIRDAAGTVVTPAVIKRFRENADKFIQYDLSNKNMTPKEIIEHVLRSFGMIATVAHTFEGYSSNSYLLEVSAGVKLSSLKKYALDIASQLNVPNVRFSQQLVVYQNKSYLALESSKPRDKDLIFSEEDLRGLKIPIGQDNFGNVIVWDLANHSTPHTLICGATGSGKSVCVRNIIEYAKLAGIRRIVILDPKYEFVSYKGIGCEVHNDIADIENAVIGLVQHMEEMVRAQREEKILLVFDEFADAFANARSGKALQGSSDKPLDENLRLLAQKGRSAGIRIVAATQRASAKIITGDTKVNFPVQICFRVPKAADSQVVLDEPGAEALTGMGDGLIRSPQYPDVVRFQAYFKPETVVV